MKLLEKIIYTDVYMTYREAFIFFFYHQGAKFVHLKIALICVLKNAKQGKQRREILKRH